MVYILTSEEHRDICVLINPLRRNYTSICIKDCVSPYIIRMDTVPTVPTKHQKAPAPKRKVHVAVLVAPAPTAEVGVLSGPANQAGVDGMDAFFRNFVSDAFSGP